MKPPHRLGTYHTQSRKVTAAARANPATRCWKCGQGIAGRYHKTGRPAWWCAGHVNPGQPGGVLLPECSLCSNAEGLAYRNRRVVDSWW